MQARLREIPAIKKLAFNLSYVRIIGTNHCDNTCRESFNHRGYFQDVLCFHYYTDQGVNNFPHEVKYKYHGGNSSVSIAVIALYHFSASTQNLPLCTP